MTTTVVVTEHRWMFRFVRLFGAALYWLTGIVALMRHREEEE